MLGLGRRHRGTNGPEFRVPEGVRAYAVGDIHGEIGLLESLQALIDADIAANAPAHVVEIYLGDYIDRGPDPAGVVQRLCRPRPHRTVFLRGNHEDYIQRFLAGQDMLAEWMHVGGGTTLASYGADPRLVLRADAMRAALEEVLPQPHRDFFAGLKLAYRLGDVMFVHAGVRPGVALDAQAREDLLMIRRPFLDGDPKLPARIVHGHTRLKAPEVRPYRIGVDTGAFATGRLTCAVLEGADVRFLST